MSLEELLPYVAFAAIAIAVSIILYATKLRRNDEEEEVLPSSKLRTAERWRYRAQRSISLDDAKEAREELRTLSLEREILSGAIRHLYEAHAEGKITEKEREQLAKRYKSRMLTVKDAIDGNESVVALQELEAMQGDLIKLFDERFDELNIKIETLRSQVSAEVQEAIVPTSIPQMEIEPLEKAPGKRAKKKTLRKPRKSRKTAAEERIEKIRTEVEEVLDRLEQMEVET